MNANKWQGLKAGVKIMSFEKRPTKQQLEAFGCDTLRGPHGGVVMFSTK